MWDAWELFRNPWADTKSSQGLVARRIERHRVAEIYGNEMTFGFLNGERLQNSPYRS